MITVAIPTYNRAAIVVETVRRLFAQKPEAIVIVDQSAGANEQLQRWNDEGRIRLERLQQPSIPHAMNVALLTATSPLVLFLDDDVEPTDGLLAAHAEAHRHDAVWAVVGQILQPGEEPRHHRKPADDLDFRFNHDEACDIANVMAGNLSVKRERAIAAGGFDENFVGAAYRFETDFALRVIAAGGLIRFEPRASLRHLKLPTGGTRAFGDHRTSPSPAHSAGDYYFAMRHRRFWPYAARRLRTNVITRYYARHPWMLAPKLVSELRGMLLARKLAAAGPRFIRRE